MCAFSQENEGLPVASIFFSEELEVRSFSENKVRNYNGGVGGVWVKF